MVFFCFVQLFYGNPERVRYVAGGGGGYGGAYQAGPHYYSDGEDYYSHRHSGHGVYPSTGRPMLPVSLSPKKMNSSFQGLLPLCKFGRSMWISVLELFLGVVFMLDNQSQFFRHNLFLSLPHGSREIGKEWGWFTVITSFFTCSLRELVSFPRFDDLDLVYWSLRAFRIKQCSGVLRPILSFFYYWFKKIQFSLLLEWCCATCGFWFWWVISLFLSVCCAGCSVECTNGQRPMCGQGERCFGHQWYVSCWTSTLVVERFVRSAMEGSMCCD